MTRFNKMLLATMTLAIGASTAAAQGVRMTIQPDSKLDLAGSSNVHNWECKTTAFIANVEMDSAFMTHPLAQVAHPISKVEVTIPIKTLKCGHSKMDSNMYEALNAEKFPDIQYTLTSYTIDQASASAETFVANTVGELTVSARPSRSKSRSRLSASRAAGHAARAPSH